MVSKGSDAGFLSKVEKAQGRSNADSIFFKDVKMSKSQFIVRHFAGEVRNLNKSNQIFATIFNPFV